MRLSLLTICLIFSCLSFAQESSKNEKIESMKVAFLSTKLELTAKEAQQFWPLYNEFQQKMEKLRKSKKSDFEDIKSKIENGTDKELTVYMDEVFATRQKELDCKKNIMKNTQKLYL